VFFDRDRKHNTVLKSERAFLLSYPKDLNWSKPAKYELNLIKLKQKDLLKYDANDDVAIVQIAKAEISEKKQGRISEGIKRITKSRILAVHRKNIKLYDDVLIGNDVYISGYPSSLGIKKIKQIDYDRPLLRRGIVAGKNDEIRTITIDCPTYGGNSGGPVIELESVKLGTKSVRIIGIIIQFVPFVEKWINPQYKLTNIEIENSGYTVVAPMDKILKIVDKF
jgi:hypothetical protein